MKNNALKLTAMTISLWVGMACAAGPESPQAADAPAAAPEASKAAAATKDITLGQYVAEGCADDVETNCKNVTAGEGRVLACLVAYEDKLSPRCKYVLHDSASMIDQLLSSLGYIKSACKADIKTLCVDVKPGGGRIAACMKANEAKVSEGCKQAIAETGIAVTSE